jgi:hypothetical protein
LTAEGEHAKFEITDAEDHLEEALCFNYLSGLDDAESGEPGK